MFTVQGTVALNEGTSEISVDFLKNTARSPTSYCYPDKVDLNSIRHTFLGKGVKVGSFADAANDNTEDMSSSQGSGECSCRL